jgi:hypothetical protein
MIAVGNSEFSGYSEYLFLSRLKKRYEASMASFVLLKVKSFSSTKFNYDFQAITQMLFYLSSKINYYNLCFASRLTEHKELSPKDNVAYWCKETWRAVVNKIPGKYAMSNATAEVFFRYVILLLS